MPAPRRDKRELTSAATSDVTWTPRAIIYQRLCYVLDEQRSGRPADGTIAGLFDIVSPYKDKKWWADMNVIADAIGSVDERAVLDLMIQAVVNLLKRHGIWVNLPETWEPGEQLLAAI